MSDDFVKGDNPSETAAKISGNIKNGDEDGFETDVEGISADAEYKGLPVFDVDDKTWGNNLSWNRQRFVPSRGSKVQEYTQKTRYKRSFYIRHEDSQGRQELRKIK